MRFTRTVQTFKHGSQYLPFWNHRTDSQVRLKPLSSSLRLTMIPIENTRVPYSYKGAAVED
jgi:hypothetical protein